MNYSYNGWPASDDKTVIDIVPLRIAASSVTYDFPGGCKAGDVHTIFSHFLPRYHAHVESLGLDGADEWGYSYRKNRNADNWSCHASGTAVDVNSERHPNGAKRTLNREQVKALRIVLAFYEGVVKWGGDFETTSDEMHYEIHGDETDVARLAHKIRATQEDELTANDLKQIDALIKKHVDAAVEKLHQEHVLILHGNATDGHVNSIDSIAKQVGVPQK
jgi:hypothetical protein